MKYVKMLGLLAVAAAALMAFVGTASATLTSPAGSAYTGTIKATGTNTHLTGTVKIACKDSVVEGSISGGATEGAVSGLSFTECNPDTVTVLKKGTIKIDKIAKGTGTVTSDGAEVTVLTHKTIFGFPITSHCIYVTNNTDIGEFTESNHAGNARAIIHINGEIPRGPSDPACGEDPAIWTGTYTVESPSTLLLD